MSRPRGNVAPTMQPFAPRPTTFLGVYQHEGWRLKVYAITFGPAPFDASSFAAGLGMASAELPVPPQAPGRFGVGFAIQHRGRGADYVVLAWWDRENELPLRVFVREQSGAATWRRAGPSESVCVWDLELIAFERDAWVATMMTAGRASDVDAYLARTWP